MLVVALAVRAFPTMPACVCIEACRHGPNLHVHKLAAVVPTQNVARKHRCSVYVADGLVQLYAFLDMAMMLCFSAHFYVFYRGTVFPCAACID